MQGQHRHMVKTDEGLMGHTGFSILALPRLCAVVSPKLQVSNMRLPNSTSLRDRTHLKCREREITVSRHK